MKTFQIVVLAIFGVGALVGLIVFSTMKGSGGAADTGPVRIWGLLPQDTMTVVLAEMTTTDKSLANVTYEEKDKTTFGVDLAQAIAEGTGPDLVIITQEELLSERAKLTVIPFETIPERTFIDTYVPIAELFLTDTGTYGMPLAVDPLVMYYNRATLTSAGVSSAPTSWEGVNGLAQTVSEVTPTGAVTKSTIALGDYANIQNARAILSAIFFQAGIPISEVSQGRTAAALTGRGESGLSVSSAAVGFYTQFADPAKTVYSWNRAMQNSRTHFLAGDLLFYLGFASERAFIGNANPNLDFDMAKLPQPSTSEERSTYGLAYVAAIPRASANPSGALGVAFTLSSPSNGALIASLSGMAPSARGMLAPLATDKYASVFYEEALRARGWLSPSASVVDGIFAGMIGNVTSGRRSIPESLQSAHDSLDAALP